MNAHAGWDSLAELFVWGFMILVLLSAIGSRK